jgi:hypothetical protein
LENEGHVRELVATPAEMRTEVMRLAKPENWEVLRPYAEKLLGEPIPSTHDDATISGFRAKLKNLFAKGKEESARVVAKAQGLFDCLKAENPYAKEIGQVAKLYSTDSSSGNDINLLLHALKEAFGYQAFDRTAPAQTEIDDLANRLKNYGDVQSLLKFDTELRAARAYVAHILPDTKNLDALCQAQSEVAGKLANIRPYIDSEVALTTELVGQSPPAPSEKGTNSALIHEYTEAYATLHDNVMAALEDQRTRIEAIPESRDFKALHTLEGISALQPPVTASARAPSPRRMLKTPPPRSPGPFGTSAGMAARPTAST